jgi:catechol 2,3-dioxygenase-like lactoylglutathione lyase family enzyme
MAPWSFFADAQVGLTIPWVAHRGVSGSLNDRSRFEVHRPNTVRSRRVGERRIFPKETGFEIDFLHGAPPFYGSVSRGEICLHFRFVHQPNFAELAAREVSLILATIEVSDVQGLFEEFKERGVEFAQTPTKQPWGGTDFQVRDPDGNVISFVTYG